MTYYPPFKHFTLMEQTPTTASDSAAMTPEPTQEQTIAAFKERLRQKVEGELKDLELELQNANDFSAGQQKGIIASIGARIHFIQLIKGTH